MWVYALDLVMHAALDSASLCAWPAGPAGPQRIELFAVTITMYGYHGHLKASACIPRSAAVSLKSSPLCADLIGAALEADGLKTGCEVGVQAGLFSKTTLSQWPSCTTYILVGMHSLTVLACVHHFHHLHHPMITTSSTLSIYSWIMGLACCVQTCGNIRYVRSCCRFT